ncbi:unnamed protein product, partial [Meganyctiphanes norvegica]
SEMLELLINLGSSVSELLHLTSRILSLSTRICSMCVVIMMNLLVITALLVILMWFLLRIVSGLNDNALLILFCLDKWAVCIKMDQTMVLITVFSCNIVYSNLWS